MRSLFVLLLVINISYLAWGVAFSERGETSEQVKLLQTEKTIRLLNEDKNIANGHSEQIAKADIKTSKVKSTEKKLSPLMAPANTCYSLGPILDDKDRKALEEKLKQNGFETQHKSITDKEPKSYWVYFPAKKNLAAAKAVVEELRDANVDDYFIIRKGESVNAISLGLYNSYGRAKVRMRRLKKHGFQPKVQTRYKDVTLHWLDFQETDDKRVDTRMWENIQKDQPLQKLARPCVAIKSKIKKK